MTAESDSPSGQYRIAISAWEVRMSLWIETPSLFDQTTGEMLLSFKDSNWSLDAARWLSDSVVKLTLRKYPGNHLPVNVIATVDCANKTAKIGPTKIQSLAELEPALEKALTWRTVTPPPPKAKGSFAAALRRFLLGK